jgi:hypothetical protein
VPPEQHTAVRRAQRNLATVTGNRDAALARAARAPQRTRSKYANTTDPQSRLMRTRNGFVQGYNTQLAVTDDHLIAAVSVTNDVVDTGQLVPGCGSGRCSPTADTPAKRTSRPPAHRS